MCDKRSACVRCWCFQLGKYTTGQDTGAYKVQGMQFTIGVGGLGTMMMRRIDDRIAGVYPEEARVRAACAHRNRGRDRARSGL
jgi:hypothetical protein